MEVFRLYYGKNTPIVARGCHQCRLLRFAHTHKGWHTFTQDRITRRAVAALAKRGALEVSGDQFRIRYP